MRLAQRPVYRTGWPRWSGVCTGVPTQVIVKAMYERTIPRVRLEDGTLGIPAEALDTFQAQAS